MILNTKLIDCTMINWRIDIFTWSTRPKIAANLFLWISIPFRFWSCTTAGNKYMFNQIGLIYFCNNTLDHMIWDCWDVNNYLQSVKLFVTVITSSHYKGSYLGYFCPRGPGRPWRPHGLPWNLPSWSYGFRVRCNFPSWSFSNARLDKQNSN